MSDTEEVMGGAVVTKGAGWTDAEKYQFMMKIIGQLTANSSVPVNLGDIDMPGRTTKSLTHLWSKIKNDAASASAGGAPTPTRAKKVTKKPATPRKKAPAKLDDDGNAVKTPRKRAAKAKVPSYDEEIKNEEMEEVKEA